MDHKESDMTEWLTVEVNSSLLATPVHLKQIDNLLFLYFFFLKCHSGSTKNHNSGSATMASHMQVPCSKERGTVLKRRKEKK